MSKITKYVIGILVLSLFVISVPALASVNTDDILTPKPPAHTKPKPPAIPNNPNNASGKITSITSTAITISLPNKGKNKKSQTVQTKTITFDNKTQVNKDSEKSKITDLKVGDNVRISLRLLPDKTYVAKSIRVMTSKTNDLIKKVQSRRAKLKSK